MIKTEDCIIAIINWVKTNPISLGSRFSPPMQDETQFMKKKKWKRIGKKQTKYNGKNVTQREFECVAFDDDFKGGIVRVYTYDDDKTILDVIFNEVA